MLDKDNFNPGKVTVVYSLYNYLGDFVVLSSLLNRFSALSVPFRCLVVHRGSPYVDLFDDLKKGLVYNIAQPLIFLRLLRRLRVLRSEGELIFGIPMAPGSVQAFAFFWFLKKLGALDYIVDFNLINADIVTPPRRRYIYDRHLAQAAELFRRPDWLDDLAMPLALPYVARRRSRGPVQLGIFPWSARSWLPEFQWPADRWSALVQAVLNLDGWQVFLLGKDPGFAAFAQSLRSALPEVQKVNFRGEPARSVEELIEQIERVDYLVTLNTSALHIAHALKKPVVVLSGSSSELWLPEGAHVRVVRDETGVLPPSDKYYHSPLQPSVQRIEVAPVWEALQDLMRCFPHAPHIAMAEKPEST